MLLEPGTTCWRRDRADRAALIIDMADYYDAAMAAMRQASRSIHFLNWAFEPQTPFHPRPGGETRPEDCIAEFLKTLADGNRKLDVRVLCWKSAMPVAATQNFFPLLDRKDFEGSRVKFVLDGKLPRGACHHQKMLVIDDVVAFCGGGDIGPDRWDTVQHLDDDPRRRMKPGKPACYPSRHEVMGLVQGAPAQVLGELFRERWLRATGEILPAPATPAKPHWPAAIPPGLAGVNVGFSRTMAAWRGAPETAEVLALHLDSIAQATRCIYMENQYFTAPAISQALARRLAERDGPEVILIGAEHSPSYFDQVTMDRTRSRFLQRLMDADRHGRFRAYSGVTSLGRTMIVHAKLTIIDDRLLRIGSANLTNRSMGFDTECDMSFEAAGPGAARHRAEIAALRTRLAAHWLGCGEALVEDAIRQHDGLGAGLEALRLAGHTRLRPIAPQPLGPVTGLIAGYHLGDPAGPGDSWRPWRRPAAIARQARGKATGG